MGSHPSFRDPGGFCFFWRGKVLRAVGPAGLPEVESFLASKTARSLSERQQIVSTRRLAHEEQVELLACADFQRLAGEREVAAVFEHERIQFPSYPYEWAPEMLHAAGQLTLEVAQSALEEGFSLKDATPYNVLFDYQGPRFIDLLSFERRNPRDPVWRPCAQFCRTFILPLLAHKSWGLRPADVFTRRRDGLEPSDVYRFCGPMQKLLPPFLGQVTLPTWLSRRPADQAVYRERLASSPEKARFILDSLFNRLRRTLDSVQPKEAKRTVWASYMSSHSYTGPVFQAKEEFVRGALATGRPARVLDIGANTGHFSALAAGAGAQVVAIDSDLGCIGMLWRRAREQDLAVLPLVIDLARPSAAEGWRNGECPSFLHRAAGAFEAVLMLAVLHHLLVTERIPLDEILDLAAELTTRWLVIEFVAPEDEMFQTLTRGREHLHAGLNQSVFETACRRRFRMVRSQPLPGTHRTLYLLEKTA